MSEKLCFLSDSEYQRIQEIRDRHASNRNSETAFDVGYLVATIFRLRECLERCAGPKANGLFAHRRRDDL